MVSTYCSLPTDALIKSQSQILNNGKENNFDYQAGLWGLPELSQKAVVPEGKPRPPPAGLPPPLNSKLKLRKISSAWRKSSNGINDNQSIHCPFWWSYQDHTPEDLMSQATVWDNWFFAPNEKSPTKMTLIGPEKSRFVFDLSYPNTQIQSVLFFHRRSWKFQESLLRLRVWSVPSGDSEEPILLATKNFNPYQEVKFSTLDLEEVALQEPVKPGEALRIEAEVLGTHSLHIMAIGACGNSASDIV